VCHVCYPCTPSSALQALSTHICITYTSCKQTIEIALFKAITTADTQKNTHQHIYSNFLSLLSLLHMSEEETLAQAADEAHLYHLSRSNAPSKRTETSHLKRRLIDEQSVSVAT
jgi:hypothetical protein